MIGGSGLSIADSMLREQMLAALILSQHAVADLLDHTAELRRAVPLHDEDMLARQRSAASQLEEWLLQAADTMRGGTTEQASEDFSQTVCRPARCKSKRPPLPWLAAGIMRGNR